MSNTAIGPNGQPMLGLFATLKAADEAQHAVFLNGLHDHADTNYDLGKLKRQKIIDGEIVITDVALDKSPSGEWVKVTTRWAVPVQVPQGPHAGQFVIPVPADANRMNERDLKTGVEKGKTHPTWKDIVQVENDPAWWPSEP